MDDYSLFNYYGIFKTFNISIEICTIYGFFFKSLCKVEMNPPTLIKFSVFSDKPVLWVFYGNISIQSVS